MSDLRAANLRRLFEPASVAVLGASDNPAKVGARPVRLLDMYGYAGRIYPINPGRAEIGGRTCYPDLAALPEVPDVVVFAIPARDVLAAVKDCAARGVAAAIVYTSGFGEVDAEGLAIEQQLRSIALQSGLIICGPNCQGTANFHNGAVLNFTSALMQARLPSGNIGLVTQSGLVGGLIVTSCVQRGLGVGYLVSTGNEAGMTLSDAVRHMAGDPRIRVIAGYVEQVRDMPAFRAAVREARAQDKPVVLLKVGRSPDAARAAASHTGSLAGAAELYDAAFAEMGVIVAASLEELTDLTMTFAAVTQRPCGSRVGILTNSGGLGVFSADEVHRHGLQMATFGAAATARISERLLDFGSANNPVDISTQAFTDVDGVGSHLDQICGDDGVDIVAVTFGLQFLNAAPLVEHIIRAAAQGAKPLLVSWVSSDQAAEARLRAAGIAVFSDPARAIRCARSLLDFAELPAADGAAAPPVPIPQAVFSTIRDAARKSATIGERDMLQILSEAGLRIPRQRLCVDGASAAAAFRAIGADAVAVKLSSPGIAHKSEIGGVKLDVATAGEAERVADAMIAAACAAVPEAHVDGVIVAEMVRGGVEVYVGAKRDPLLGVFVMVGLGGVFVEVLNDIIISPAPVSPVQAEAMLRRLKGYPLLDGARGRPAADVAALADTIATISAVAAGAPELEELDLNPVVVRPRGQGCVVLDAWAQLDTVHQVPRS